MQHSFRIAYTCWVASLILGLIIVGLLPDNLLGAHPLLRFSNDHGPTALDALGITPAVIATAYYLWYVWQLRKKLGLRSHVLIAIWAIASAMAIIAASFNMNQLLIISIILGIGSLLVLGAYMIIKKD